MASCHRSGVREWCIFLIGIFGSANCWSGSVCSRQECVYRTETVCAYYNWGSCCAWKTVTTPYTYTVYFCCSGYTHDGSQNCIIPVCSPPCKNGGTCISPGVCRCTSAYTGFRCDNAICSYQSPCFPGACTTGDSCTCDSGFQTVPAWNKPLYCLTMTDAASHNVSVLQMQIAMSFWTTTNKPGVDPTVPMEAYKILADSTNLQGTTDVFWTNRKYFNKVHTLCASQFSTTASALAPPPYIANFSFGIVQGQVNLYLKKLPVFPGQNTTFTSLNKTVSCKQTVSSTKPATDIFNCTVDDIFDRSLEHGDELLFTYETTGGGYRQLRNPDSGALLDLQQFSSGSLKRSLSVLFKFDFRAPVHCQLTSPSACGPSDVMLRVPDVTSTGRITLEWGGWQDADSGLYRYAWEVFPMSKASDGELEVYPGRALQPLQPPVEVLHASYTPQSFDLPQPGLYSVILEVSDRANNSVFVRRLVLFDAGSAVTPDPARGFFVASASPAANYSYQNTTSGPVVVTWDGHFRNAFHEDGWLLGSVRAYGPELPDMELAESKSPFRKVIERSTPQDDHDGKRTVSAIPNKRAIVNFKIQYAIDSRGGSGQPALPAAWIDHGLNTSFTLPTPVAESETVTFWVKATDFLGRERVEQTRVSFDSTPPVILQDGQLKFHRNVPVPGLEFSSTLELLTNDKESGVEFVLWTFRRVSNSSQILHQQKVYGVTLQAGECRPEDALTCNCVSTGRCFRYNNSFSLPNCLLATGLDAEALRSESVHVTADVTNMAGLVTSRSFTVNELTKLNGTQDYFPPQNVTAVTVTRDSVTLRWWFPPSCFVRQRLTLEVVGGAAAQHHHQIVAEATQFTVGGLLPDTEYRFSLLALYAGDVSSVRVPVVFRTLADEDKGLGGGAIAGIVIGLLILICLLVLITIFLLWRKGKVFQKEGTPVNKQLHRVSRAFDNVRKTVKLGREGRDRSGFQNHAYKADGENDEVYVYGAMTFQTQPAWHMTGSDLHLLENIGEGKFASVYRAHWKRSGRQEAVAAKMLKVGFNQDDVLKMQAKINFMATQLEDHENVIRFLGAVVDNKQWGPVLVMEYCETGQLDRWLCSNRGSMTEQLMERLFRFCLGIASGMNYLASKKVVHRRLAARNILLTFTLEPKVAGFGPQRKENVSEGEDQKSRIPAKWSAPEVLQDKPPTEKSDIWSFGVVLWEIFSMGEVPYPGIRANEIGSRLQSGYRMEKPEFADDFFYDQMQSCWQYKPSKRPTFSTVRARLAQFLSPAQRHSTDFYYDSSELKH